MFSGIIEKSVPILSLTKNGDGSRALLAIKNFQLDPSQDNSIKIGDSIAINGCCLTVASMPTGQLLFDVGLSTLNTTNLGMLKPGDHINIERSLKIGDGISGHLVSGHIDDLVEVEEIKEQDSLRFVRFFYPEVKKSCLLEKGSVCLDGVSLTVQTLREEDAGVFFDVMIIPTSLTHTNLSRLKVGQKVNVEWDMLGKWVKKWLRT